MPLTEPRGAALFGFSSGAYESSYESSFHPPPARWQVALLLMIASLPTISIVVVLDNMHHIVASMLVFHWVGAVIAPACYCLFAERLACSGPVQFFTEQWVGYAVQQRQVVGALLLFLVGMVVSLGGVAAMSQWCWLVQDLYLPLKSRIVDEGMDMSLSGTVLFMLYFTFVNSLIEEIFWRGFLVRRLGSTRLAFATSSFFYALYRTSPPLLPRPLGHSPSPAEPLARRSVDRAPPWQTFLFSLLYCRERRASISGALPSLPSASWALGRCWPPSTFALACSSPGRSMRWPTEPSCLSYLLLATMSSCQQAALSIHCDHMCNTSCSSGPPPIIYYFLAPAASITYPSVHVVMYSVHRQPKY